MEHLQFLITHLGNAISIGQDAPMCISKSDLKVLEEVYERLENKLKRHEAWLHRPIKVRVQRAAG